MAIFNEAYILEATSKGVKFISSDTKVEDKDNLLSDKKIVSAINGAWSKVKTERDAFINSLIDEWYKSKDGSYDYGANTPAKVMKFATLDYFEVKKRSDKAVVYIWYNNYRGHKDAEKFFAGHSLFITYDISLDDYKVSNIDCSL